MYTYAFAKAYKQNINLLKLKCNIVLIFLLLLATQTAAAQCAMCRAVLESETDNSLAEGVNNGIIFLMAVPYVLVGGLGYILYRARKKRKAAQSELDI